MAGYSSEASYESLISSVSVDVSQKAATKLGLIMIITFLVISSPIVMLVNPGLQAASDPSDPTKSAPSTIGQGGDFTTQAALSSLSARPSNNIVNKASFYDIVFQTATSGTIKKIEVTFPADTFVPNAAFLNEVEGIGPGTTSKSGKTIIYTVTNAVNVPAGTNIRLEFANVNNPTNPGSYQVSVVTKDAADVPIDGPTQSTTYGMKGIGTTDITDSAITTAKLGDDAITTDKVASSFAYKRVLADGESGWNPDGTAINFPISDTLFDVAEAVVVVNLDGDSTAPIATCAVSNLTFESFVVTCTSAPPSGAELRYAVFTPAPP
jgi:hypothetical protein